MKMLLRVAPIGGRPISSSRLRTSYERVWEGFPRTLRFTLRKATRKCCSSIRRNQGGECTSIPIPSSP